MLKVNAPAAASELDGRDAARAGSKCAQGIIGDAILEVAKVHDVGAARSRGRAARGGEQDEAPGEFGTTQSPNEPRHAHRGARAAGEERVVTPRE